MMDYRGLIVASALLTMVPAALVAADPQGLGANR